MTVLPTRLEYADTKRFSALVEAYLQADLRLESFCSGFPSLAVLQQRVEAQLQSPKDRTTLVRALKRQYEAQGSLAQVQPLLDRLQQPNCLTIATAHQPNLFTGPLYVVYKILHAIKLAAYAREQFPAVDFLPVFWMGSEDADLAELGEVYWEGQLLRWATDQQGAVGRMQVDETLLALLHQIRGQALVKPHGAWLMELLDAGFSEKQTIAAATQQVLIRLFADFPLLVLNPDEPALKRLFVPVMERELRTGFSHPLVETTAAAFPAELGPQRLGRAINLFYLQAQARDRIEPQGAHQFRIGSSTDLYSEEALVQLLHEYPERFSPNVVLRPLYQETVLPNVAFIGGGGELAYWLHLKRVFTESAVPFPLLVLRHSLLLLEPRVARVAERFELYGAGLFQDQEAFRRDWVTKHVETDLTLTDMRKSIAQQYSQIQALANQVDSSLNDHVARLLKQADHRLEALEKKMYRAAKHRLSADMRQLDQLLEALFPNQNLQERVHGSIHYLAAYGPQWLHQLYGAMPSGLSAGFTVASLNNA